MNDDIGVYKKLIQLTNLFQWLNQLSWAIDQTRKRYTAPETLTLEEMKNLTTVYMALGEELEEIYAKWEKVTKDEK